MGRPVVHFEVVGQDAGRLQSFYGELFDWKINAENPMNYGMVDTGGDGINGGVGASPDGKGYVTFYVRVESIDEALRSAEGLGGKTVMPRTEMGDMVTMALVADPEGNVVGLVQ